MAQNSEKWEKTIQGYKTYIRLEKNLSANSVEAYVRDITVFANFILRKYDVLPAEVDEDMISQYLVHLNTIQHKRTSQARELSAVNSFYNYLLMTDAIEILPTEFIATPKAGKHLPDTLSVEEIDALISVIDPSTAKGVRDRAILETLYSCGLRVSELTSLRMGDLFFGEGYVRVVGKGDKQRIIPLQTELIARIQRYITLCRENGLTMENNSKLIIGSTGKPLSRITVQRIVAQELSAAGIQGRKSPHVLRHTFATQLLAKGAGMREIQELMGHASLTSTQHYTHTDIGQLQGAYDSAHPHR